MVRDCVTLKGFRLWAVESWVSQPGRFYSSFLHRTGLPSDTVKVCVVVCNDKISPSQQSFIFEKFFQSKPSEGLSAEECRLGTILCSSDPPVTEVVGPAFHLPGGDYDKEISLVKMSITLKALTIYSPTLSSQQRSDLIQSYQLALEEEDDGHGLEDKGFADVLVCFIKDVQVALRHLNLFPYLCKIDGIFSDVLTKSILMFQKRFNCSSEEQSQRGGLSEVVCTHPLCPDDRTEPLYHRRRSFTPMDYLSPQIAFLRTVSSHHRPGRA